MSNLSVDQALEDIRAAEDALKRALATNFPAGCLVYWKRSGATQEGIVLKTTGEKVEVQNISTGSKYFLYAFWLTARWGGGRLLDGREHNGMPEASR